MFWTVYLDDDVEEIILVKQSFNRNNLDHLIREHEISLIQQLAGKKTLALDRINFNAIIELLWS